MAEGSSLSIFQAVEGAANIFAQGNQVLAMRDPRLWAMDKLLVSRSGFENRTIG